jgi:hypothetical protein
VSAVCAEGSAEFLTADLADVMIHAHTNEAGERVVRGTVQVGAPVDRDLARATRFVWLVRIFYGLRSRIQDRPAFIAGSSSVRVAEWHFIKVARAEGCIPETLILQDDDADRGMTGRSTRLQN